MQWAFWKYGGLWASYISILVYYLWAFYIYYQAYSRRNIDTKPVNQEILNWLRLLIIVVGVLLVVYSPSLFKYVGYIGGCVLYTVGIYVVSLIIIKGNQQTKSISQKYQSSSLTESQLLKLKQTLENIMLNEKSYQDSQLTLNKLAQKLSTSPNHLSQLINSYYQKSYSDYINDLRIEEVKHLLTQEKFNHYTITALAFESGFNSASSFYTAFKKSTGQTPTQYKKELAGKK